MKTLMIAALAALLGLANSATAATLGFSVEATSQTLGGVTDVIFHFDVTDPNVTFTPTSASVDFGLAVGSVLIPAPSPTWTSPAFVTSYIYAAAGTYSVSGSLSGYFSDDPAIYDFSNGTTVTISGFSDVPGTPIPATLPLFLSALGGLGFVGWRRHRPNV